MTKPTEASLHAAVEVLTRHGFKMVKRDAHSARLQGPGLNSTKQNPLLGASVIDLTLRGQQLCLDAELGGVAGMRKFLTWFPLLLGLGLGVLFGVVGGFLFGQQFGVGFGVPWAPGWKWLMVAMGGALLPVSPWLFLAPLISRMISNRTQLALTTLVENSAQFPGSL